MIFSKLTNNFQETFETLSGILLKKGNDYATEDALSNFKRLSSAANILGIDVKTPIGYSLFMVLMKLDRINNLLTSGKTPKNESVADSFNDLLGYGFLSKCIYMESVDVKEAS